MANDDRRLPSRDVLRSLGEDNDFADRAGALLSRTLHELALPLHSWRAHAAAAGVCLFLGGFLLGLAAIVIQDYDPDIGRTLGPLFIGAAVLGIVLVKLDRPGVVQTDHGPLALFLNDRTHPTSILGEQGGEVVLNCQLPAVPGAGEEGAGVVGACRDLAFFLLDSLHADRVGLETPVVIRAEARARALFALEAFVSSLEACGGRVHLGSRFPKRWALASFGISVATTAAFPSAAVFVGTILAGVIVTLVASLRSDARREVSLDDRRWATDTDLTERRYEVLLRSQENEIRVSVAMPAYEDLRSAESRAEVMREIEEQLAEDCPRAG